MSASKRLLELGPNHIEPQLFKDVCEVIGHNAMLIETLQKVSYEPYLDLKRRDS